MASPEFQQAVYAPARRVAARVVFSLADPDAVAGATVTLPPGAPVSRPEQVTNGRWDVSRRYGTYEQDYWRLDGSFVVPPDPGEGELPLDEIGWWSGVISDEDGVFNPPLVIAVQLTTPVDTPGLSVVFDRAAVEYAADFDLIVTAGGSPVTRQIRDNTRAMVAHWEELTGVTEVQLVIHRWRTGYRRARVAEIVIGPVEEFDRGSLTRMSVLDDLDVLGETAPASELTFAVDNSDQRFNLFNPTGLASYLRERQRMTAQIGVEVSGVMAWVDLGVFFLREWQSDEGALTASFTARDRLDLLDQGAFEGDYSAGGATLSEVAEDVLGFAGVPAVHYELPAFLAGITTSWHAKGVSPRQALVWIAQAAQAVLMVDRDDTLRFVRLPVEPTAVDDITYDRAFSRPRIEQAAPLGRVLVDIYSAGGNVTDTYEHDTGTLGEALRIRNPLITDNSTAQAVAEWLAAWSAYRHLYTVEYRGNPALEAGDAVSIQDDFAADRTSIITSHELRYSGGLRGTLRTRGSW